MTLKTDRRIPKQARSRQKVDMILRTARQLIGAHGNDAVSMREIAAKAEMPISTIYQYFPDKSALLHLIMQHYLDLTRDQLRAHFDAVSSTEQFLTQIDPAIDDFFDLFQQDPALAVLWGAMQADPKLCSLEAETSQSNAVYLSNKLTDLAPHIEADAAKLALWHMLHSVSTSAQLALYMSKKDRDRLADELKLTLRLRLKALLAD
ncbi:TetR/AcrR family transcriptional regulator [Maritalea mediterranea]|uniref:TetR/AcrR family transcriptional regulator n=1 Tax=Maritalea mediterranea TaxID=2909667 RepID=A0ABS9E804_9HYPH|nr:TetR/AcrR family transcriptional regulator [Maritalea mediterranea]MCF4098972.1 TetR/AcrR family transcriptional regulator [Maritalea mediterranea]